MRQKYFYISLMTTFCLLNLKCVYAEDITISNEKLAITVSPEHGGELSSFRVKHNKKVNELLFKGNEYSDSNGWRGKAPLLWPTTGPTKKLISLTTDYKKLYELNDVFYPMPTHGFVRDLNWQVISQTTNSIMLGVSDSIQTMKFYPFKFQLSVDYQLNGNQLNITYKVLANKTNDGNMPFSIGNHITFKWPLIKGSELHKSFFTTSCNKEIERKKGLPTGNIIKSNLNGQLNIDDLPEKKSVSLTGCGINKYVDMHDESGLNLLIHHQVEQANQVPPLKVDFNLWASQKEGFFSPEPWVGMQNSLNSGLGLVQLAPGEHWQWNISLMISKNNGNKQ